MDLSKLPAAKLAAILPLLAVRAESDRLRAVRAQVLAENALPQAGHPSRGRA